MGGNGSARLCDYLSNIQQELLFTRSFGASPHRTPRSSHAPGLPAEARRVSTTWPPAGYRMIAVATRPPIENAPTSSKLGSKGRRIADPFGKQAVL
jgi:hypothetical protein